MGISAFAFHLDAHFPQFNHCEKEKRHF